MNNTGTTIWPTHTDDGIYGVYASDGTGVPIFLIDNYPIKYGECIPPYVVVNHERYSRSHTDSFGLTVFEREFQVGDRVRLINDLDSLEVYIVTGTDRGSDSENHLYIQVKPCEQDIANETLTGVGMGVSKVFRLVELREEHFPVTPKHDIFLGGGGNKCVAVPDPIYWDD